MPRMFDDCLHDNSLLSELKEWFSLSSRFSLPPLGQVNVMVRNYPDVCKDL